MRILLAFVLMTPASAAVGADRIVGPDMRDARLQGTNLARIQDLGAVDRLLESPLAQRAEARLGADPGRTRAALATLSDAELRELAERVRALEADPAAGLTSSTNDILIIALVVLIVLLVLRAV